MCRSQNRYANRDAHLADQKIDLKDVLMDLLYLSQIVLTEQLAIRRGKDSL